MVSQLTLDVGLPVHSNLENFFMGDNATVIAALREFCSTEGRGFIYLWGDQGVGKTHLLQACCNLLNKNGQRNAYLPLGEFSTQSPAILEGLEQLTFLAIDDVDHIAGIPMWEEALFHCYNRLVDSGCRLLISAVCPPAQLMLNLPDLTSRLTQGFIFQLHVLTDEHKLLMLQERAKERGFILTDEVARYMLTRCPRGTSQLFSLLDRLDKASLSAQHRLTVPFVKQVVFSDK